MGKLLNRIFTGKALGAATTRILIGIMERCRTGEGRLPGRMPPGTVVAHKTGMIGGTVNDVGVLTLPSDAGRAMIAVFIEKSDAAIETGSEPSLRSAVRFATIICTTDSLDS